VRKSLLFDATTPLRNYARKHVIDERDSLSAERPLREAAAEFNRHAHHDCRDPIRYGCPASGPNCSGDPLRVQPLASKGTVRAIQFIEVKSGKQRLML
jgi:hypothetical protein